MVKNLVWIAVVTLVLSACQSPMQKVAFQGDAQGTYYAVTYFDEGGRNFQPEVDSLLKAFDQSLSLWVDSSVLSRINRGDTPVVTDSLFSRVFRRSTEISILTEGAFDATVGPLVKAWGFSFKGKIKLDSAKVDSLKRLVNFRDVKVSNGSVVFADKRMQLDFNAIAQGYSVDLIGELLASKGLNSYLVDVGGEVLARGTKPTGEPWVVGIEKPTNDPDDPNREVETALMVTDLAVATSGSYRKFYVDNGIRRSHAIDPATGYPVTHSTLSVTVVADDAITADALATAFMVMGSGRALTFLTNHPQYNAWFIDAAPDSGFVHLYSPGMEKLIRR